MKIRKRKKHLIDKTKKIGRENVLPFHPDADFLPRTDCSGPAGLNKKGQTR